MTSGMSLLEGRLEALALNHVRDSYKMTSGTFLIEGRLEALALNRVRGSYIWLEVYSFLKDVWKLLPQNM